MTQKPNTKTCGTCKYSCDHNDASYSSAGGCFAVIGNCSVYDLEDYDKWELFVPSEPEEQPEIGFSSDKGIRSPHGQLSTPLDSQLEAHMADYHRLAPAKASHEYNEHIH